MCNAIGDVNQILVNCLSQGHGRRAPGRAVAQTRGAWAVFLPRAVHFASGLPDRRRKRARLARDDARCGVPDTLSQMRRARCVVTAALSRLRCHGCVVTGRPRARRKARAPPLAAPSRLCTAARLQMPRPVQLAGTGTPPANAARHHDDYIARKASTRAQGGRCDAFPAAVIHRAHRVCRGAPAVAQAASHTMSPPPLPRPGPARW